MQLQACLQRRNDRQAKRAGDLVDKGNSPTKEQKKNEKKEKEGAARRLELGIQSALSGPA